MLYDEEHGEYCKYKNGVGPGDVSTVSHWQTWPKLKSLSFFPFSFQFRAPEEYLNKPLDEKIDIFSLGNNFVS